MQNRITELEDLVFLTNKDLNSIKSENYEKQGTIKELKTELNFV